MYYVLWTGSVNMAEVPMWREFEFLDDAEFHEDHLIRLGHKPTSIRIVKDEYQDV